MGNNKLIVLDYIDPKFCEQQFGTILQDDGMPDDSKFKDAIVLYGVGNDIDPKLYGEPHGPRTDSPNLKRDAWEKFIFDEYKDIVKGFVGICRGAQFLTAMNGGRLLQHVDGHAGRIHTITTYDGRKLIANSLHHQMMWPFDLPKDAYEIIAWTTPNVSGLDIVESEVVWYPGTRCLCIQGHPEYYDPRHPFPTYCRELIDNLLLGGNNT